MDSIFFEKESGNTKKKKKLFRGAGKWVKDRERERERVKNETSLPTCRIRGIGQSLWQLLLNRCHETDDVDNGFFSLSLFFLFG